MWTELTRREVGIRAIIDWISLEYLQESDLRRASLGIIAEERLGSTKPKRQQSFHLFLPAAPTSRSSVSKKSTPLSKERISRYPGVWLRDEIQKSRADFPEARLIIPPTPSRRVPDTSPAQTAPSSIHSP